jgi:hypothetical protein
VLDGLADEAWRGQGDGREGRRPALLGEALAAVAELRQDPVSRVRLAAERATAILTAAGA